MQSVLYGLLLSTGGVTLLRPVGGAQRAGRQPGGAMRPEPPKGSGRMFLEKLTFFWRWLTHLADESKGASTGTAAGFLVVTGGSWSGRGLLVVGLFFQDAVDYMRSGISSKSKSTIILFRLSVPVRTNELYNITVWTGCSWRSRCWRCRLSSGPATW
jgi:putative ABC transport system permease protein